MSIKTVVHTVLAIKMKTSTLDIQLKHADNGTIYQLMVQNTFCKPFVKICGAED
jgi:hypothetical protein